MTRRLVICLTDAQYELLQKVANQTRISMAEHIRTLIDREFRTAARPPRNGIGFSLGITRRPDEPFFGRRPGVRFVG